MIALKHQEGWSVMIRRADGSKFFACGSDGVITPVWPKNRRSYAKTFADNLRSHFDARVVPVTYAHPVEIPRGKK